MRIFTAILVLLLLVIHSDAQRRTCDTSIERHVFNPKRFKVLDSCITVKGTVRRLVPGRDGDLHIALKPDSGYGYRLNSNNLLKWDSCLVCEIICQHEPDSNAGVGGICKDYLNNIQAPVVGDHIAITGKFVEDDGKGILGFYGWNEIHPVTKIELIK